MKINEIKKRTFHFKTMMNTKTFKIVHEDVKLVDLK